MKARLIAYSTSFLFLLLGPICLAQTPPHRIFDDLPTDPMTDPITDPCGQALEKGVNPLKAILEPLEKYWFVKQTKKAARTEEILQKEILDHYTVGVDSNLTEISRQSSDSAESPFDSQKIAESLDHWASRSISQKKILSNADATWLDYYSRKVSYTSPIIQEALKTKLLFHTAELQMMSDLGHMISAIQGLLTMAQISRFELPALRALETQTEWIRPIHWGGDLDSIELIKRSAAEYFEVAFSSLQMTKAEQMSLLAHSKLPAMSKQDAEKIFAANTWPTLTGLQSLLGDSFVLSAYQTLVQESLHRLETLIYRNLFHRDIERVLQWLETPGLESNHVQALEDATARMRYVAQKPPSKTRKEDSVLYYAQRFERFKTHPLRLEMWDRSPFILKDFEQPRVNRHAKNGNDLSIKRLELGGSPQAYAMALARWRAIRFLDELFIEEKISIRNGNSWKDSQIRKGQ